MENERFGTHNRPRIACLVLATLLISTISLYAEPHRGTPRHNSWGWRLPQNLSDTNTKVSFALDSTWHKLHGSSSQISGRVWLEDEKQPLSIRATINFPVMRFTTGGEMRDERMQEVMDSEHYKYVTLVIDSFEPACQIDSFADGAPCPVRIGARLSIRGVERPVVLPGLLTRSTELVSISGDVQFSWLDFGVEDPSILIAKLDPEMRVTYTVTLPATPRVME